MAAVPIRTLFMLSLLLLIPRYAKAQQSPTPNYSNGGGGGEDDSNTPPYGYRTRFNPSMATVIVVLISSFFFIVFFSIYARRCGGSRGDSADVVVTVRQKAGLSPELLATFPVLVYAEVKGLKIGKGSLECAVCLSEFEDHETLRLVPKCNHVFHSDCIDAWLADHVTCPVCRSLLADDDPANPQSPPDTGVAVELAVVSIDEELAELARIGSRRKAAESTAPFPRSHTTGHSLVLPGENLERFTLRLPEQIRREIIAAGNSTSVQQLRMRQEWGSRSGYRGGEGEEVVSAAGRSVRLGRSGRWSAFFGRNLSARVPARESGRRWEEGLGTMKKSASLRAQFDCLGGARLDVADDESCTARLNRV